MTDASASEQTPAPSASPIKLHDALLVGIVLLAAFTRIWRLGEPRTCYFRRGLLSYDGDGDPARPIDRVGVSRAREYAPAAVQGPDGGVRGGVRCEGFPALGYTAHRLWYSPNRLGRYAVITFLLMVGAAFIYFFPHWTAIDVPRWLDGTYYWFRSWQ